MSDSVDQWGRVLPLPGHFKDCPHGLTGWAFCTCPERRRPIGGSAEKWPEPEPSNPDRAQLAALSLDAPARAHAARLARERADREARAVDHFAD